MLHGEDVMFLSISILPGTLPPNWLLLTFLLVSNEIRYVFHFILPLLFFLNHKVNKDIWMEIPNSIKQAFN